MKDKSWMNTSAPVADRPLSWLETLLGLFPFFLFSPLKVWLGYPFPYAPGSLSQWFMSSQTQLFVLCLLFGLLAGAVTRWRRWSFSYLWLGILMVGLWILSAPNRWLYVIVPRQQPGSLEELLVTCSAFAVSMGTLALFLLVSIFLVRTVSVFHLLYERILQDWTQLSFGLYTVAAVALSAVDHDEDPVFTVLLILPGLAMLLGALAYLRSTTRSRRIGSLVVGLLLALSLSIVNHWFYILYGVVLVPIIFLPLLLELLSGQNKMILTE